MSNLGVFPLDPASDVGRVRLEIGDVNAEPASPPVEGQAEYDWFGDNEILQFLSGGESILRACGRAVRQLALGKTLAGGVSIKTDDLSIDAKTRGTSLLSIADSYFADADEEEARADADLFVVVPFSIDDDRSYIIGL